MATSGQVARLLGISPTSLKNWEKLGVVTPEITTGGWRNYEQRDVCNLRKYLERKRLQINQKRKMK